MSSQRLRAPYRNFNDILSKFGAHFILWAARILMRKKCSGAISNGVRVFLPLVLKGCVEWARENNRKRITAAEMQVINDKSANEKNKK